ncbi:SDR family NAD(P)-dependent oxidoreductase [Microbispora cellulosiformans]|uniref:SDR family NAD(P)-dependent oxidoreductase n=1 Tax=Microbispora cellulosiformans TaxID=2614688 RepID=A0A5J5K4R4_9ACTN|nr:SDR family NAD(P)-dependent oxidoreductase [Microbispora cellulosiformans]KAA9378415.1 SDR family NAD(P)-dependent oxidoreductase [Microbispora cellulosiformans]
MRLAGARVLVTGASSGIGTAIALELWARRARLVLSGRDREALAAVAARTGGEVVPADLAQDGTEELAARAGPVDVLVANAGEGWSGPLTRMPGGTAERLIAVNLTAHVRLTRLLLPAMIERGRGHLVYVASIAGVVGVPEEAVYAATKAGLLAFAESLRYELPGIGVTTVVPGVVDTPFFARRGTPYARRRPAPVPPERVARAVAVAVERGRAEVYMPAWLRLPARLHGAAPGPFRALARRFG